jgi:hypothetical protein
VRRVLEHALQAALAAASTCGAGALALGACDDGAVDGTSSGSTSASTGAEMMDAGPDADGDPPDPCESFVFDPVVPDDCGSYVRFPCGLPSGIAPVEGAGCFFPHAQCDSICRALYFSCHATDEMCSDAGVFTPGPDGAVDVDCVVCPGSVGRVPAGLQPADARSTSGGGGLGAYFARAAHLERASVHAFERMARELRAMRAPRRLVALARRSADEERSHGRRTARLARRFGATPSRVRLRPVGARSVEMFATENAVEGCVREALGALVAAHQAVAATDPRIRRTISAIAGEEARHAALSFDVLAWTTRRLDADARARVARRMTLAIDALTSGPFDREIDRDTATILGLPDDRARFAMTRSLQSGVWDGALRALLSVGPPSFGV